MQWRKQAGYKHLTSFCNLSVSLIRHLLLKVILSAHFVLIFCVGKESFCSWVVWLAFFSIQGVMVTKLHETFVEVGIGTITTQLAVTTVVEMSMACSHINWPVAQLANIMLAFGKLFNHFNWIWFNVVSKARVQSSMLGFVLALFFSVPCGLLLDTCCFRTTHLSLQKSVCSTGSIFFITLSAFVPGLVHQKFLFTTIYSATLLD